jgi:hypothetical protein
MRTIPSPPSAPSGRRKPPARVGDVDRQALLLRPREPERLQPRGQARATAAGSHHEVRRDHALGAAVLTGEGSHARDAASVLGGHEPDDIATVDDGDAGQRRDPAAHVALEERAARVDRARAGRRACELVAVEHHAQIRQPLARRGSRRNELVGEPGQQRVQARLPVREQRVRVPALRHRPSGLGAGG